MNRWRVIRVRTGLPIVHGRRGTRGRRRRARLALVVALALALPSCAWIAAPLDWRLDLVGNLSAHVLAVVSVAAVLWTVCRYRAAAVVGWASVAVLVWPLASGRARWAEGEAKPDLTLLTFNARVTWREAEAEIRVVRESGADLVAVIEPPDPMVPATRPRGGLSDLYPYSIYRGWRTDPPSSYQVLMSRYPLTDLADEPFESIDDGVVAAVAHTPAGRIGVVVLHPRSPRNAERWRQGLAAVAEATAAAVRFQEAGLPVIVMGDLNSTPSGLNSRRLCAGAALRRCKPWLRAEGTFRIDRAWPWRVALDDVLVSDRFRVRSWETLEPAGSDHAPVRVGVMVARE